MRLQKTDRNFALQPKKSWNQCSIWSANVWHATVFLWKIATRKGWTFELAIERIPFFSISFFSFRHAAKVAHFTISRPSRSIEVTYSTASFCSHFTIEVNVLMTFWSSWKKKCQDIKCVNQTNFYLISSSKALTWSNVCVSSLYKSVQNKSSTGFVSLSKSG